MFKWVVQIMKYKGEEFVQQVFSIKNITDCAPGDL